MREEASITRYGERVLEFPEWFDGTDAGAQLVARASLARRAVPPLLATVVLPRWQRTAEQCEQLDLIEPGKRYVVNLTDPVSGLRFNHNALCISAELQQDPDGAPLRLCTFLGLSAVIEMAMIWDDPDSGQWDEELWG